MLAYAAGAIPVSYFGDFFLIYFISDLHLTPKDTALTQQFGAFIDQLTSADNLYILGDLFEYWLGDDTAEYLGQQSIETDLRHLTDRGVEVFFLRGNRDFLVGLDFCARTGCCLLPEQHILTNTTTPILLLHGDSLCTEDTEHQAFRLLVRNDTWQSDFLARSIVERDSMARAVRYRSESGKRIKPADIMDVNPETVFEKMRGAEVRLMIHGHTHRPAIHRLEDERAGPMVRIVLGDWGPAPSFAKLDGSSLELWCGDDADRITLT
ncbi:MAG TPA: UDP-2,3-diacylglucosamine diphosphatase [Gammaproteobacteria bacterium]|nr:UDP-2,3-diacylglucosamine diphosphatase [Arenicellales bacterium]HCY14347.1 UDP-2,3-diacylglucosamine diphosphatase [Gammaproteobacteria bacterium]